MQQILQTLQTLTAKTKQSLKVIWDTCRVPLIVLGSLFLLVKFRDIIISLLVNSGKSLFQKQEQKSDQLKQKEDSLNQQADQLVNQAKQLQEQQQNSTVDENWYKKK